jgi:hypothetical protein
MGIELPNDMRLNVEHYAQLSRVHAVEAVACLVWLMRQRSAKLAPIARAAAVDLLKFSFGTPDQVVKVRHGGTVQVEHADAVSRAFLARVLGPPLAARVEDTGEPIVQHQQMRAPAGTPAGSITSNVLPMTESGLESGPGSEPDRREGHS